VLTAVPSPRVPRAILLGATLLGAALGLTYTLTPLTVWCLVAAAAVIAWTVRGLPERERRLVRIALVTALAVRVAAVAVLFLTADPQRGTFATVFSDEAYLQARALRLRNLWLGVQMSPWWLYNVYEETAWTGYITVIAWLQYLFGPAPYAIRLLNAVMYLAAASLLYRLVRPVFGGAAALLGLTLVLFLPSMFIWSVSVLKESLYFLVTATVLVCGVAAVRHAGWRRIGAVAFIVAAALVLESLRRGGIAVVAAGILGGYAARLLTLKRPVFAAAVVVLPCLAIAALQQPAIQTKVSAALLLAADRHRGYVTTPGHAYKLLDERFYTLRNNDLRSMTRDEQLRYVGRAVSSFVLVPLPWQLATKSELAFVPEQMVWYVLVALAAIGFVTALRRDALVACLLAAYAVAAAGVIAFNSGNVGTLVRHRSVVLPYVMWFSALGAVWVATHGPGRRRPSQA
jgi:hypothetical protein